MEHEVDDAAIVELTKLFGTHAEIVNIVRKKMLAG